LNVQGFTRVPNLIDYQEGEEKVCQTNVVMEHGDSEELLLENVTDLQIIDGGLIMATLFEGPKEFPGVAFRRIDFNEGKVYLYKLES